MEAGRNSARGVDRRAHYRLTFYCEAEIEALSSGRSNCRIGDVSVGGAFVEARSALTPGTLSSIRFSLLGHEIVAPIEVRYTLPGLGMGVRFTALSQSAEAIIRTLITREAKVKQKQG